MTPARRRFRTWAATRSQTRRPPTPLEEEVRKLAADRNLSLRDIHMTLGLTKNAEMYGFLRRVLGEEDYLRRRRMSYDQRNVTTAMPAEEILADMRRVHALAPDDPLSGPFFDRHSQSVRSVRVIQRWGTWTKACQAAGVPAPMPIRPEYWLTYDREMCIEAVRTYLEEFPQGTYAGYEQWAREREFTPSAGTLRNRIDRKWSVIRRLVLEGDA